MLRSMYSGISGMKNFQTKLDVIGNNIANVNTYGFKKGRTIFKDMMSQNITGATGPAQSRGGINPKQVGLGSQLASIDTVHTTGSLQTTSRVLDLAISGDGFFQVTTNPTQTSTFNSDSAMFTRAGNFYLDKDGYLVNSDGLYVMGFASYATGTYTAPDGTTYNNVTLSPEPTGVSSITFDMDGNGTNSTPTIKGSNTATSDPNFAPTFYVEYKPIKIPTDAQSMSIGKDGTITYVDQFGTLRWAGKLVLAKFPNNGGLEKVGNNIYQRTTNSGDPVFNFAGESGLGSVESGYLEMSNVDLSEEFTEMITAQRGFQANTRIITTSDEILQELVNLKR